MTYPEKPGRKYNEVEQILVFVFMNCPACKEKFMTKKSLRNHLHIHHTKLELRKLLMKLE